MNHRDETNPDFVESAHRVDCWAVGGSLFLIVLVVLVLALTFDWF